MPELRKPEEVIVERRVGAAHPDPQCRAGDGAEKHGDECVPEKVDGDGLVRVTEGFEDGDLFTLGRDES
jgi:hypothetical protein